MHEATTTPLIELIDVSKLFVLGPTNVHALRHVSLTVSAGDFIALRGPSGTGKSTLLNLIGCLDRPTSGQILIDGIDVGGLPESTLDRLRSRSIGFVFQNFNLVPVLRAVENVMLPLYLHGISEREMKQRALEKLELVGLSRFANALPDQLSGGQRQRVSIARALAVNPRVILADEPTASLDSGTAESIIDLMHNLNQRYGVTCLFATHDDSLTRRARRVVHLLDGQIAEHHESNILHERYGPHVACRAASGTPR